jgi:hypothetical protein
MADTRGRVRRLLPLLLAVLMVVWIAVIVALIALSPAPGSGNPMN